METASEFWVFPKLRCAFMDEILVLMVEAIWNSY
jgi:hypothetical protein